MKEIKVYVEREPEIISQNMNDDWSLEVRMWFYDTDKVTLKDIKTHDRELVKEVCEKIKEQLGFIVDGQERIVCDGSATGDKTILAVLNQIQKEFEK